MTSYPREDKTKRWQKKTETTFIKSETAYIKIYRCLRKDERGCTFCYIFYLMTFISHSMQKKTGTSVFGSVPVSFILRVVLRISLGLF